MRYTAILLSLTVILCVGSFLPAASASRWMPPQTGKQVQQPVIVGQNVVVGAADWTAQLNRNKQAFIQGWVLRPAFQAAYAGLSDAGYVEALLGHIGTRLSEDERDALVNSLSSGASTRAEVLRQIVEHPDFVAAKRNETFVMLQYFAYLRRDPDDSGFQFWLDELNKQPPGSYRNLVQAFIISTEYQQRFSLRGGSRE